MYQLERDTKVAPQGARAVGAGARVPIVGGDPAEVDPKLLSFQVAQVLKNRSMKRLGNHEVSMSRSWQKQTTRDGEIASKLM